jgi:dienelactone hydrolase
MKARYQFASRIMNTDESPQQQPLRWRQRTGRRLTAIVHAMAPSRVAWWGASAAVLIAALVMWLSAAVGVVTPDSVAAPLLVGAAGVMVAVLAAGLLILVLAIVRRAPLYFRWAVLTAFVLLAGSLTLVNLELPVILGLIALTLAAASLAGGSTAVLMSGRWRKQRWLGRSATAVFAAAGIGSIVAASFWLAGSGGPRGEIADEPSPQVAATAPASVTDPAAMGRYTVKTVTYGAGTDAHRPEFAEQADLRTETIDGSKVLKGWKGFTGWARTRFWGFDAKKLPLNGRVWYPLGNGPFPLVLVVHGNHLASDFSDPGYQYLGQLLASRGYIFVSVDENFLNSMETDLFGGLEKENNARGWLLLEHLRIWHEWNAQKEHLFFGKVDTDRIALMGHSRGGEAVAHAAAFNRIGYNPDNADARFNYDYHIRSIVAIAPADAQYRPADTRTPLTNINYFTIQGSHDSDVSSFDGLNQFDRVKFSGEGAWFKSAVYVYAANHGQFNTRWGQFDTGVGLVKRLANTRALLDADQQRRIAEVYISAFLDCTLRDVAEFRRLFQDCRYGSVWLPKTVYVTQYADSGMQPLCTFDEDLDLATAGARGGTIAGDNLTRWREGCVKLRDGLNEDRAVFLGWDRDQKSGQPSYAITWPAQAFQLGEDSVLSFCLADADLDPTPEEAEAKVAAKKTDDKEREPIDLTVELTDSEGHTASLPLSHNRKLRPQIKTPYFKSALLQWRSLSEPIFQTFLFPLSDFHTVNADFDPSKTVRLRLIFDRTTSGVVILDRVAVGTLK